MSRLASERMDSKRSSTTELSQYQLGESLPTKAPASCRVPSPRDKKVKVAWRKAGR
jgi:hypothetical protein